MLVKKGFVGGNLFRDTYFGMSVLTIVPCFVVELESI